MSSFTCHITLLYNSYSGKGKGVSVAKQIEKTLLKKSISFISYCNLWPEDFPPEEEIWLVGGDGTLNFFINKYGIVHNNITLFAGGTGNDFHWHLYGKVTIENQIKIALESYPKSVDVALCNDKYFINMVGLGFDGAVLKNINAVKWIGGHLAYLIAVIKNIFQYKERTIHVRLDGKVIDKKLLLCIIANAPRTGGGFLVSPKSQTNDGKLNWIACQPLSLIERLGLLPKVEKGMHLSHAKVEDSLITKIEIEAPHTIYYQLDGELMSGHKLVIDVVPSALQFRY